MLYVFLIIFALAFTTALVLPSSKIASWTVTKICNLVTPKQPNKVSPSERICTGV